MSRFVLLEFEDDDLAEKFIAKTQNHTEQGANYRVAGLFARPNIWCKCPFQIAGVNRPVNRGKKYGWWVCAWCKKPRPGTHHLVNIIPTPPEPISPRYYQYGVDNLSVYEVPNPNRKGRTDE